MSMLLRRYHSKAETPEPETPKTPEGEAPAGNASREEWTEYATSQGKTPEELGGLGRDAIRALLTE